jgi:hypothetical protein
LPGRTEIQLGPSAPSAHCSAEEVDAVDEAVAHPVSRQDADQFGPLYDDVLGVASVCLIILKVLQVEPAEERLPAQIDVCAAQAGGGRRRTPWRLRRTTG